MFSNFKYFFVGITLLLLSPISFCLTEVYIFLGGNSARDAEFYIKEVNIRGAQIIYSWRALEPLKDIYDFSKIKKDIAFLKKYNKNLFIQIQDRSFTPDNIPVPNYLLAQGKPYFGGIVGQIDNPGEGLPKAHGWVAKQWLPAVRARFQKLLLALAQEFDGIVKGINLSETAIDLDEADKPAHFCENYVQSIQENMLFARSTFRNSTVVQYINFIPCEWQNSKGYIEGLFKLASKNHIGIGNPDTVPYKKSHMENAYYWIKQYKAKLPLITMAIQEPDYTYTNPKTGNKFTIEDLYEFDKNYLGAHLIFWNIQEPQFSQQVLPYLSMSRLKQKYSLA